MKLAVVLATGLCLPLLSSSGETPKIFEGTVAATETRGGVASKLLYTRKADLLRVETPEPAEPLRINILNLAEQKLTIISPHNRSFTTVDLKAAAEPAATKLPPGFPSPPPMPSAVVNPGGPPGPAMSPPAGFPPIPPMPPTPNRGGMPMMPPMPGIGMETKLELKKTDQTKTIQGYDCALYTITNRGETMEIWATPDSNLFPFHLLQMSFQRRHFGPPMLEVAWTELLQKQKLFPIEAVVRTDPKSQARYSFQVDKVEPHKVADEGIFKAPESYFESRPPDS